MILAVPFAAAAGKVVAGLFKGAQAAKGGGKLMSKLGDLDTSPANIATGAIGLAKTIKGKHMQKKADAMLPASEDPEVRRMQREFSRRKRAFQTGTAMASQRQALKEQAKQGMQASFKMGGGSRGLNMMSRMFNQGMQGLAAQGLQGEQAYAGMETDLVKRMAQRKLELGMQRHDIAQARAAQTLKEGKSASNLALARTIGLGDVDTSVLTGNPYSQKPPVEGQNN